MGRRGNGHGWQWGTWIGEGRKEPLHANPRQWNTEANGGGAKETDQQSKCHFGGCIIWVRVQISRAWVSG